MNNTAALHADAERNGRSNAKGRIAAPRIVRRACAVKKGIKPS